MNFSTVYVALQALSSISDSRPAILWEYYTIRAAVCIAGKCNFVSLWSDKLKLDTDKMVLHSDQGSVYVSKAFNERYYALDVPRWHTNRQRSHGSNKWLDQNVTAYRFPCNRKWQNWAGNCRVCYLLQRTAPGVFFELPDAETIQRVLFSNFRCIISQFHLRKNSKNLSSFYSLLQLGGSRSTRQRKWMENGWSISPSTITAWGQSSFPMCSLCLLRKCLWIREKA